MLIRLLPVVLLVAACASNAPQAPTATATTGEFIGVLNLVPEEYTHQHIGTTAFNNANRPARIPEQLSSELTRAAVSAIQSVTRMPVVVVAAPPQLLQAARDEKLTSMGWSAPVLRAEWRPLIDQLRAQAKLRHLVILDLDEMYAGYGMKPGRGMGIYTRSFMGIDHGRAMLTVNYALIDPASYKLEHLALGSPPYAEQWRYAEISGFDWPDQVDENAPFEAARVVPLLRQLIASQTQAMAKSLQAKL